MIRLLSRLGIVTVDWKAAKAVKKGDAVTVAGVTGFALAGAKKNEVVAVCTEAHLVLVPKASATVFAPFARVKLDSSGNAVAASAGEVAVGLVHHEAGNGDTEVGVVWRHLPGEAMPSVGSAQAVRAEAIKFRSETYPKGETKELRPVAATPITVILGRGPSEILTGLSGNDFTVAAGAYLVKFQGSNVTVSSARSAVQHLARKASDDSLLAASSYPYWREKKMSQPGYDYGAVLLLVVDQPTAINIAARQLSPSPANFRAGVEVTFARL